MSTINDAIKKVLTNYPDGLTVKEIYQKIIAEGLYTFNSPTPEHIVHTQIRRRCAGLELKSAQQKKLYTAFGSGRYKLLV